MNTKRLAVLPAAAGIAGENPQTCLATVTSSGTYKVTGGTGRYKGVQGHGTYSRMLLRRFTEADAGALAALYSDPRWVMEKCGLRRVSTFHYRGAHLMPGGEHGDFVYELTRSDWTGRVKNES